MSSVAEVSVIPIYLRAVQAVCLGMLEFVTGEKLAGIELRFVAQAIACAGRGQMGFLHHSMWG